MENKVSVAGGCFLLFAFGVLYLIIRFSMNGPSEGNFIDLFVAYLVAVSLVLAFLSLFWDLLRKTIEGRKTPSYK